jgi:hypothetical protein
VRGNPHAAFDVAGAGNVAWSRWCDTRRRKGEPTGNTNFDLNRRVSPRPYRHLTLVFFLMAALSAVGGNRSPIPTLASQWNHFPGFSQFMQAKAEFFHI